MLNFKSNSINSQILDNAVNTFWKFNLGTCISVVEQREPVFKLTAKGLKSLSDGRYADYKLKTDELWRMNNVLVISKKNFSNNIFDGNVGYFEMSAEESVLINDW